MNGDKVILTALGCPLEVGGIYSDLSGDVYHVEEERDEMVLVYHSDGARVRAVLCDVSMDLCLGTIENNPDLMTWKQWG